MKISYSHVKISYLLSKSLPLYILINPTCLSECGLVCSPGPVGTCPLCESPITGDGPVKRAASQDVARSHHDS